MKKAVLAIAIALGAFTGKADVITNYVYVVSNIFNNVYSESVVTQKVKSTHTNYYFTNYVSVVTNVYQTTFQTNIEVNVIFDNFEPWVIAASNQAANASSFASAAASNATDAASSASSASSAASRAAASASSASSAASDGLNRINERIQWFDEHSGETITMITITSNVYINVNAQDWSYTYTNANGVAFDYVTVHPYGADGGATVAARASNQYSTIGIRAWPKPRNGGVWWDFYPAYIDYDENGMRLQYLPDTTTPIQYQDANGAYPTGKIVPEYFYWQSGYIYFKVRVWVNGAVVAWCLTRYQWSNWPNTINYGTDNGQVMALVSRQAYGDSAMGSNLAYFYTMSRTGSANTPIHFPMNPSASYNATLDWMKNGPIVSDLQDQVAELANQWTGVSEQWTAFHGAVSEGISDLSNRVANAENGYPHAYTSPGGTTYSNIIYYDRATDDGKVAITTVGNYYPSLEYRVVPNYGGNVTANYWIFEPAYIDTDANGLRLHYLPKEEKTITATTYNAGYKYVPRDFYWQGGVIYVEIDSYNGTTWSGRIRLKYAGTGATEYPSGINATYAGTTLNTTHYKNMTFDSREGTIMGTSTSATFGYLKTEYQKVMPSYTSVLWFPESPSVAQQAIVNWLATWTR